MVTPMLCVFGLRVRVLRAGSGLGSGYHPSSPPTNYLTVWIVPPVCKSLSLPYPYDRWALGSTVGGCLGEAGAPHYLSLDYRNYSTCTVRGGSSG